MKVAVSCTIKFNSRPDLNESRDIYVHPTLSKTVFMKWIENAILTDDSIQSLALKNTELVESATVTKLTTSKPWEERISNGCN